MNTHFVSDLGGVGGCAEEVIFCGGDGWEKEGTRKAHVGGAVRRGVDRTIPHKTLDPVNTKVLFDEGE